MLLFLALLVAIYMEMNYTVVPLNKSLTQQVVNARSDQINDWFTQRIGEIDMLASLASDHKWSRDELLQEIRKLEAKKGEEYESIRVVDAQAHSWSEKDQPFSILNRPYYQRMMDTKASYVVSNPIFSKANGVEIVVILYKVSPAVDDEVVYIAAAVSIEKVKEIAHDISLYDRSGQLLIDCRALSSESPSEPMTQQASRNEGISTFEAPIDSVHGWKLVLEVPNSELSLAVVKTQRTALLVGILIGGVFIVLFMLLASSVIRPIQSLRRVMKNVQSGDKNVRADESRTDEIGDLGRSFNEMLVQMYRSEQEKKEIELRLVHEQIKPHFLYNTLDTIQWMARDYGADNVVEMVEALSTYFRLGLGAGSPYISLEQELYHVESYLHIQCVRYEEILDYELHCEEDLLEHKVIRFMLQPLVENAIYHGIKPLGDQKCTISISAQKEERQAVIRVENDGAMIPADKLEQINQALIEDKYDSSATGFGLYSVNHRIRLAYGEAYGLSVSSSDGITRMIIAIPLEGEWNGDVEDRNR
ncbi:histidine kinase [Paenibacillus sp. 1001270B_150601_E10]|uniref:histidine kinase n=1 Tax=Paenibacillus sp. 1001270B_150601_E10 TaxID=2787079 RepID=UPI001E285443|nr:histidine kinase [Paenibacillus sp. 1001270B_150601_E10]